MEHNVQLLTVLFLLLVNSFRVSLCEKNISWNLYHAQERLFNNETFTESNQTTASTSQPTTEIPKPISKPCEFIIGNISNVVSTFYRCSIERARPYRFCTKCVQEYMSAVQLYSAIDEAGKNSTLIICKNLLMKSDYAPLIPAVFQDIEALWGSAYCTSCYSQSDNKEKTELNNRTIEFIDSYKEMIGCVENNTNAQSKMNICLNCTKNYKNLNTKFKKIEDYSSPSICMDVMDMMNYTRLLWSQNCPTKTSQDNKVLTITASISLMVITIIYYLCMYLIGKGKIFNFYKYKPLSNNSNSIYRSISDIPGINTPSTSSQRQ